MIEIPEEGQPTLQPKGLGQIYLSPSASRVGMQHITVVTENSNVICSCEGYQHRHKCWHVEALTDADDDDIEVSL